MAMTKVSTNATTGFSGGFTNGVVSRIEAAAYKELYDNGVLSKLCKKVGQGSKGSGLIYPYFDPTTIATAGSTLTEGNDFITTTALTNASVIIVASEMGIRTDISDALMESTMADIEGEVSRQHGIGCAVSLEKHILNAIAGAVTTGTITGTNSTTGFSFTHYAAARARLRALALTVPKGLCAVIPEYAWYYGAKSTFSSTYASTMGKPGEMVTNRYYIDTLFGDLDLYRHSLAFVAASSSAAGFMFAKNEAVGLWTPRDFRLEQQRDASNRANELVSTFRAGAKPLITGYIKRLAMYAAAPTG